ncbi:MAG: YicC family protein [SAR324 cluster bacterium]|nr:YicC family protein [SAR324 cluster bacterium]
MSLRSMTGFGRAEKSAGGWRCGAELRSVNGRFLETRLKLPPGLLHLEAELKAIIGARCERGKFDCTLSLIPQENGKAVLALNKPLAEEYRHLLAACEEIFGRQIQITLGNLAAIRDLILADRWEEEQEVVEPLLKTTLAAALEELIGMREREGGGLVAEMRQRLAALRRLMGEIAGIAEHLPERTAQRLRANLARLAGGVLPEEERLLQEVAILAERADVSEEIARFNTHLEHLENLMEAGGAVGRKFDFLLQELNREANTLANKSNDGQVSTRVVEIKSELEKLREQIQNIE